MNQWSGCALTDPDMEVEDGHIERQDIPSTYVPARNMVFLSVAASWADALDITDIFIGVSEVDYSGYVDCREEFIKAMENAINLGLTWTCYRGGEHPCGVCDSCLLRAKAFAEANEIDPLVC